MRRCASGSAAPSMWWVSGGRWTMPSIPTPAGSRKKSRSSCATINRRTPRCRCANPCIAGASGRYCSIRTSTARTARNAYTSRSQCRGMERPCSVTGCVTAGSRMGDKDDDKSAKEPGGPGGPGSPDGPGGVHHDARGNAVWQWAVGSGRHALESTSRLLKRLEVPGLKLEDDPDVLKDNAAAQEPGDPAGPARTVGYDPYGGVRAGAGGGGAKRRKGAAGAAPPAPTPPAAAA